jgi:hypothetical protein
MKFLPNALTNRIALSMLCGAVLAACGGGGGAGGTGSASSTAADVQASTTSSTSASDSVQLATTSTSTSTALSSAIVTDVRLENTNAQTAQTNVPFTFGQVFAVGAVKPGTSFMGLLDGTSVVPLQIDVKATHADGSIRHAIISGVLPSVAAGATRTLTLIKSSTVQAASTTTPDALLSAGFSASVHAAIGGVDYAASADNLLKTAAHTTWLNGPVVNEWHVTAPLTTSDGVAHPHLSARFDVRWYPSVRKARVDVTVENDWAYEPAPQNFTYDASVVVGGQQVYQKTGLTHLHHARWRKVFWWGTSAPELNVKENTRYLIATGALPNFDPTVTVSSTALSALQTKWTGTITEPMGVGMANPYMPTTGGRGDIGLLPSWATEYLLSMDKRARDVTLGTADLAGSWSSHYRDRNTGQPVSLIDYPYMTIVGHQADTYNPVTKKYEAFPACASSTACTTPYTHDASHQPAFAYLPYLVTGDYYYLEELQFWAMWDAFETNPGYRDNVKGLVKPEQVRGQAWSLRTLAEAAYITPDDDRLKAHFTSIVESNLDWYNANYTNNPSANALGIIVNGPALGYASGTGMAPWMDDFFTSAVGHAADLGFTEAQSLLAWKAKFPISRLIGAGYCWISAPIYELIVRDSSTSAFYTNIGQAYAASHTADFNALACNSQAMATALNLKVGEMTGYSAVPTGYPSNLQPAAAYAASAGGADGKAAWTVFMNRSVKPDYSAAPQFAIVPR